MSDSGEILFWYMSFNPFSDTFISKISGDVKVYREATDTFENIKRKFRRKLLIE